MRIFYVNVIEENAGWGAEWFVNRSFNVLGHTTYCVDYRRNRNRLYKHFLDADETDVFLLQRGDYLPISLIKSINVPRFFWASELVSRCRDQDRLLASGLFDHIFLHSYECLESVVSRGWVDQHRCSVLLNGFDETLHRPILGTTKNIDILFVGSMTQRRKAIMDKVKSYFNVTTVPAFGEELVRLFNRAKIVLNIHADDFLDTETRVFEALGCGAFLLTERLSPENPFSQNELAEFDTVKELCDKLRYFLNNDDERNEIAHQGHMTALKGHTYTHRAQEIVDVMSVYLRKKNNQHGGSVSPNWRMYAYGMSEPFLRAGERLSYRTRQFLCKVRQLFNVSCNS